MNVPQQQVEKAWLDIGEHNRHCFQSCAGCALEFQAMCGVRELKAWLLNNGFPASRPHVHTTKSLSEKIKAGYSKPTLVLWLNDHVEAVECPDCGKQILYRETRKRCTGCGKIYPAERWAAGEPCECGSVNAKYAGKYTSSQFGHMEFQQCNTDACRWNDNYRPLTMQDLTNEAARAAGDEYDQL